MHWTIRAVNLEFLADIVVFNKEPIVILTSDWHALMSHPYPSRFIHLKHAQNV